MESAIQGIDAPADILFTRLGITAVWLMPFQP